MVGAGLQAHRRLEALDSRDSLHVVSAPDTVAAAELAGRYGGRAVHRWEDVVSDRDVDAVIVATPPDVHEPITVAALRAGKHVLCEKPLARTSTEARNMARAAAEAGRVLLCGFNHRFHPAVAALAATVSAGTYGRPLSAVGVYGHGIRADYLSEWRADPKVVSGGQLMEQGIHLVDLVDSLLWPVADVVAHTQTSFGTSAELEDDAHVMLRSGEGQLAFLRSSLSQWRNHFSLDVTFERATVRVHGLGGSYGEQTLAVDVRDDGPFTSHVTAYRGADRTWSAEWQHFRQLTQAHPVPPPDLAGQRALSIVEAAYASTREGRWTTVPTEDS